MLEKANETIDSNIEESGTYKQIAKSTGIFAGSQGINMAAGIVRTKILALLLGPAGVGLVGLYQSVIDVVKSLAGLGLSFSTVKDIAQATSTNNETQLTETITVTRKLVWWTSTVGAILMILFSDSISSFVFHNQSHTLSISLLSFCVFSGLISSGQMALLQGTRQLLSMAKASVYGTLVGLVVSISLYAWLGIDGIVPALMGISLISLFFSWFFTRSLRSMRVSMPFKAVWKKGGAMIKLGLASMLSGLIATAVMMFIKTFILKETQQEEVVGLYQAVWSLSTLYISALLSAMSTDYYPRLCSLESDSKAMVDFANKQTRFVMLVSTPLVVLVLLFTPVILTLFYTQSFLPATSLMLMQILGTFLKLVIWPVAFFLLAKGKGGLFLVSEFSWHACYYLSTVLLWPYFGLTAAGIGYVVAYLVYIPLVWVMVKSLCPFKLTTHNTRLLILLTILTLSVFLSLFFLEGLLKWSIALVITVGVIVLCLQKLNDIVPINDIIKKLKQWRKR